MTYVIALPCVDVKDRACVGADVFAPLFGNVVFVVDGLDGADGLAGAAVHALVGVDVQGAVTFVDAVHGAFFNAGAVFDIHAGTRDNGGHGSVPVSMLCALCPPV